MLDELLENLADDPRKLLVLTILVWAGIFSLLTLPLIMISLPLLKVIDKRYCLAVLAVVIVMIVAAWLIDSTGPMLLHLVSHGLFYDFIHADFSRYRSAPLWIFASPYAISIAAIIAIILQSSGSIKNELKQVAKGKSLKESKLLSKRVLEKKFKKLTSSAIQDGSLLGLNRSTGKPVILADHDANLHTFIIGTTPQLMSRMPKAGKTPGDFLPIAIRRQLGSISVVYKPSHHWIYL